MSLRRPLTRKDWWPTRCPRISKSAAKGDRSGSAQRETAGLQGQLQGPIQTGGETRALRSAAWAAGFSARHRSMASDSEESGPGRAGRATQGRYLGGCVSGGSARHSIPGPRCVGCRDRPRSNSQFRGQTAPWERRHAAMGRLPGDIRGEHPGAVCKPCGRQQGQGPLRRGQGGRSHGRTWSPKA